MLLTCMAASVLASADAAAGRAEDAPGPRQPLISCASAPVRVYTATVSKVTKSMDMGHIVGSFHQNVSGLPRGGCVAQRSQCL